MLPSFIIFLYDFLIWNFSYSITHTSKNKLMQSYISLSLLEGGGGNQLKTIETIREIFPVVTSDKRVAGTASLSLSSP